MGIDVFKISLSTPPDHVYRPGDIVKGTVQLNVSPDTDLSEGMMVTLYGLAHVKWVVRHRNHQTSFYEGNDKLFEDSILYVVSNDQKIYPFSLTIPNNPCLPWTTVTPHGRVEYGVMAIIKRPWFQMGNKSANAIFTLNSHMNSRVTSAAISSYRGSATASNSDTTKTVSLWAYPGEDVHFSLYVDNTGTRWKTGSTKVQLIGTWTHLGQCEVLLGSANAPAVEKETETLFYEEIIPMRILPGEAQTQKGKLKVPMDVMPTQVDCKGVMDEISRFPFIKRSATVEVDILIGTLGANETTILNGNVD